MKGTSLAQSGLRVPRKAARADTRATNLRLVLQHLLGGKVLSRAELARLTELTPATVSTLVGQLERDGLVAEVGYRRDTAQIGKPPTMFEVRADARCMVALDLSDPETLRSAIVDLAGGIGARLEAPNGGASGTEALGRVKDLTARTIEEATSPVLGVGVGTPGVVTAAGQVVEASNFGWHHVALRDELESLVGHPTYVSNDANVAALAEYTKGGHDANSLAVVRIGSGVGAGFVLDGQPYYGEHAGAGEIGHLVVDPDGPPCRCGNRGCLETFVGLPAIEAAMAAEGADVSVVRGAAAERLGIALASMVAILDLHNVIVAGPSALLGDDFCSIVNASLRTRCLDAVAEQVSVQFTSLGPDIVLLGAAGLVLSQELGVA